MTSLTGLYEWLVAGKAASKAATRRSEGQDYRLRALPREDIHLFVKDIDNAKVARLVDAKDNAFSFGVAGSAVLAAALLIAMLMPGGYSLLASRRMERLRVERETLTNQLNEIRVREARMLSPQQMEKWASQEFVEPPASAVVFASPSKTTVASIAK
jgi:hypothetical protein